MSKWKITKEGEEILDALESEEKMEKLIKKALKNTE